MSVTTHPASAEDVARLWPAVKASRLMGSATEFAGYREAGPWRVRVTEAGEALVLGPWRNHLEILAIKGLWAAPHRIEALLDDAASVARSQGFSEVLSPLLSASEVGPYLAADMAATEQIVALQGLAQDIALDGERSSVSVRSGSPDDVERLVELDARCFNDFWRYGSHEFVECMAHERTVIAGQGGVVLGYATCAIHGAAATIGRLAVAPDARRRGIATALLAALGSYALNSGVYAMTLCTQEDNAASRALYTSLSFRELPERYVLAARRV